MIIRKIYINFLHRKAFALIGSFGSRSVSFGYLSSLASGGLPRFQFLPLRLNTKGMDRKNRRCFALYLKGRGGTNPIVPVISYTDLLIQKKQIMQDNKGKSGIYLWKNETN